MPISLKQVLARPESPNRKRIIAFLDSSKDGELFTVEEIEKAAGCNRQVFGSIRGGPPDGYWIQVRQRRYYGKPSTISAAKKALEGGK